MPASPELGGRRFGRLLVIERAGSHPLGGALWRCRCDCGNTHVVRARCLLVGASTSCGCRADEIMHAPKYRDRTGKRFGKWTAIRYMRNATGAGKCAIWLCRCECGTEREVRVTDLTSGASESCGCSFGRDVDLTGMRFGRLLVLGRGLTFKRGRRAWLCRCDCGAETVTLGQYLKNGDTTIGEAACA